MKPYPDGVWYTVEVWQNGCWNDSGGQFTNLKDARAELRWVSSFPQKCAIIKHTTTATLVEQKP